MYIYMCIPSADMRVFWCLCLFSAALYISRYTWVRIYPHASALTRTCETTQPHQRTQTCAECHGARDLTPPQVK